MTDLRALANQISKEMQQGTWGQNIILTGFIRCICGKIHTRSGISHNSVCTCNTNLYARAWDRA